MASSLQLADLSDKQASIGVVSYDLGAFDFSGPILTCGIGVGEAR